MVSLHAVITLLRTVAGAKRAVGLLFRFVRPLPHDGPVVKQLIAQGYPIRQVNVAQEPNLAAQFQITPHPLFPDGGRRPGSHSNGRHNVRRKTWRKCAARNAGGIGRRGSDRCCMPPSTVVAGGENGPGYCPVDPPAMRTPADSPAPSPAGWHTEPAAAPATEADARAGGRQRTAAHRGLGRLVGWLRDDHRRAARRGPHPHLRPHLPCFAR